MASFRVVVGMLVLFAAAGCTALGVGSERVGAQAEKAAILDELALWQAIEQTENLGLIHKYLSLYPDGRFALPAKVRLLEAGPVDAPGALARGLAAYQERRFSEALRFVWPQAELGEPLAQQKLGLMYLAGWGIEPDVVQAFKWLTLAEAGGADGAKNSRAFAGATLSPEQHEAALGLIEKFRPLRRVYGDGA